LIICLDSVFSPVVHYTYTQGERAARGHLMGQRVSENGNTVSDFMESETRWKFRGACNGADPGLFDTSNRNNQRLVDKIYPRRNRYAEAKKICNGCVVKLECFSWAMEYEEPTGVWGGLTARERRKIAAGSNVETIALGGSGD